MGRLPEAPIGAGLLEAPGPSKGGALEHHAPGPGAIAQLHVHQHSLTRIGAARLEPPT